MFYGFFGIKRNIEIVKFILKWFGKIRENQVVMGWLSLMIMSLEIWRWGCLLYSAERAAGGDVGLWSACHLAAAFLMLFSMGQRHSVNTNEIEPCLLTSPLQGERNKECVSYYTSPLATNLTPKHNVSIGIDCMNCTLQVMIYYIEFEAVLYFSLVTRRIWFSVRTQTRYRSAPRIWTAPWAKPPGPSRRPRKR